MTRRTILLSFLVFIAAVVGCSSAPDHADVVARLGDRVLTADQVHTALGPLPPGIDSTRAIEQIIQQWLTDELFAAEARRLGLHNEADVVHRLEDAERSVLASTFLTELNRTEDQVDPNDVLHYFEENRERMRLSEPYVRIRYIESATEEEAGEVRQLLQDAMRSGTRNVQDSFFLAAVHQFAVDTLTPPSLYSSLIPQSRLTSASPNSPWTIVGQMGNGEISPILTTPDSTFFVIQLVERIPQGTEPELEWVLEDVERSIVIRNRRLRAARETERLRTEAEARGQLHIYYP